MMDVGFRLVLCTLVIVSVDCRGEAEESSDLVLARAEALLAEPLVTVMDKTSVAPSGDKHDYFALAPYHWPNPRSANGQPYVWRDGKVNPEANGDAYDRVTYFRMGDAVTYLAVAYGLSNDARFAARSVEWIRAWYIHPATRMNPNLSYAQCIPGRPGGLAIGIIRGITILHVVQSAEILKSSEAWTDSDRKGFQDWLRSYLEWVETSELGRIEGKAANNHGTWHAAQIAMLSLFLGDDARARRKVEEVRASRIHRQILPDGRQPLEMIRTKSWDYSVMNLEGLVVLADIGRCVGVDLWGFESDDGRGLRTAFEYLVPYALGTRRWPGVQIREFRGDILLPSLDRARQVWHDAPFLDGTDVIETDDPGVIVKRNLLAVSLTK